MVVIVVGIKSVLMLGSRRSTVEPIALALTVGRRFDVVGIETDPGRFWSTALDCSADIAVVEASVVDAASVRELLRLCPAMRILLLGDPGDPQVVDLLVAGADGFFPQGVSPETIVEAVRMLDESGVLLTPPLSRYVLDRLRQLESRHGAMGMSKPKLGDREALVLRLLATGATNKEIAKNLGVSVSTVKNQVASVLRKLQATNRSEAVALAFRLGLADSP